MIDFKFTKWFPSMSMLHHIEETLKWFDILQNKFIWINVILTWLEIKMVVQLALMLMIIAIDCFPWSQNNNSLILIPVHNVSMKPKTITL